MPSFFLHEMHPFYSSQAEKNRILPELYHSGDSFLNYI